LLLANVDAIALDANSKALYVTTRWGSCFQFNDWSLSAMKNCNIPAAKKRQKRISKWKGGTLGLALDPNGKYLFARASKGAADRGIAVAPDGGIAVLGSMVKNDKKDPLNFYQANDSVAPRIAKCFTLRQDHCFQHRVHLQVRAHWHTRPREFIFHGAHCSPENL
jgi:hypothetical protein